MLGHPNTSVQKAAAGPFLSGPRPLCRRRTPPCYEQREAGVALITMLLVCAVMTAVVTRLAFSNEIWLRQTSNIAAEVGAIEAATAAQLWGEIILDRDDPAYDGYLDTWAQALPSLPVAGGAVGGRVNDLQARFNLNNLVADDGRADAVAVEQFERLLRVLGLESRMVDAVVDWIDANREPSGTWGAEDAYYLGLRPSYLAPNHKFSSAQELRLVRGIDDTAWERLRPFVTALPRRTDVNVNTASAEVLAAVMTNWGPPQNALGKAAQWAQRVRTSPVHDLATFAREALGDDVDALPPGLAVATRYFVGHLEVEFGNVRYRSAAVFDRGGGKTRTLRHTRVF